MNPALITELLTAIRDAVASNRRQDDVAVPRFDPATSDSGAEAWCSNIETLGAEFGWSGIAMVAKAGKALKGSALVWFETWEPDTGRTWANFRNELTDLYPPKKNLSEKLSRAVLYNSDSADSYCEYAREKMRLLKNTKINFTEAQLVELVCGSIRDVNVKMASFNSNVQTTSELMTLFTTYSKIKKRPLEQNGDNKYDDRSGPSGTKRSKPNDDVQDKRCFSCGKSGHIKSQCFRLPESPKNNDKNESIKIPSPPKKCTICKKIGHDEGSCWFKDKTKSTAITNTDNLQPPKVNCFTKSS